MLPLLIATQAQATTFAGSVPTLSSLAYLATCVVSGVVTDAESVRAPWGMVTRYDIAVERAYVGRCGDSVTIELPGGREGDLVQTYGGVPLWTVGDEVLVFVPGYTDMPLTGVFTIRDHVVVDPLSRWSDREVLDDEIEEVIGRR